MSEATTYRGREQMDAVKARAAQAEAAATSRRTNALPSIEIEEAREKAAERKDLRKQAAKTKKGARVAKPRKASSADKMQKKFAAGLAAKTEQLLGERAGHLELIGAGRKKNKAGGLADKGKKGAAAKGGSRKFG